MNPYDLPKYYDLSYSYNMQDELAFLKRVFRRCRGAEHPRLLEPACGTGRLLVPLIRSGFDVTGFDLNPHALDYLKKKLRRNRLHAHVFSADMASFSSKRPKFEGAYCTVDTFRHLLTDEEAICHLRNVSRYLKRNGIYVLGLHLLPRQGFMEKLHRWHGSRGRLTVYSSINVLDVDRERRAETLSYTLRTGIKKYRFVYTLRTYTLNQFHRLLDKAGCFEITNVYDLDYDLNKPVQLNTQSEEAVLFLKNR